MNFKGINEDNQCNCLEDGYEDCENVFVRKINKPSALDKDFKSHWERGKKSEKCDEICGLKGLSFNLWNEENKEKILKKFLLTFSITPKSKDSIFLFKIKSGAGLIKHTPNKNDHSHYDFYKCDEFEKSMLEEMEVTELKNFYGKI